MTNSNDTASIPAPGWIRAAVRIAEFATIQTVLVWVLMALIAHPGDTDESLANQARALGLITAPIIWFVWLRVLEPLVIEKYGASPIKRMVGLQVVEKGSLTKATIDAHRTRNRALWRSLWLGLPMLWAVGAMILVLKLKRGVEEPHNVAGNTRVVMLDIERAQIWGVVIWVLYIAMFFFK